MGWKFEKCPFMSIYAAAWVIFDNSKDFRWMKIWKMSIYVHLCCSMGDIFIIQKILVGWNLRNVHLCPFMLQYGWYFDNSKDCGMKIWKNVHVCPFMLQYGWYLFNSIKSKKHLPELKPIFYVHLWDILCTPFFSIPEDALKCFFKFYILCSGSSLYIYINLFLLVLYTIFCVFMCLMCFFNHIPVVPHKAVAEVSE